jgi:hypothetical protein
MRPHGTRYLKRHDHAEAKHDGASGSGANRGVRERARHGVQPFDVNTLDEERGVNGDRRGVGKQGRW